jgi:hypothetical protein
MPSPAPSQFRLALAYLEALDSLAAHNGGKRSPALRDAIAYWRRAVGEAGRANALALTPEDWTRLASLNDPGGALDGLEDHEEGRPLAVDWSARLAHELVGMWEGRRLLPPHAEEAKECRALARRIAGWGLARGYALYAALRHFWTRPEAGVGGGDWWHPESWLTPTAKGA